MRATTVVAAFSLWAAAATGCGGGDNGSSFSAGKFTVAVADKAFYHWADSTACPTGGLGQLELDFVDYPYLCDPKNPPQRDGRAEHTALQVIVTIGAPPDYAQHYPTKGPYQVGTADCAFGTGSSEAIGQILHYQPNASAPDAPYQATSGTVNILGFDPTFKLPLSGNFDLKFPDGSEIKNTFSLDSCN